MAVTLDIEENLYECLSRFGVVATIKAAAAAAGVLDVGDVMVLPAGVDGIAEETEVGRCGFTR